ncbi:hypothetical protein EVAR_14019_1 [Eumeta japonica]|uniref:Uncharacterized protein n=1 Tax=Eumeta variegata TaxID=151549 RepID=A0A4C1XD76_EUMVA|nr:hypothetical protein EVAR_14019_1 [Eumeta japonica]
MQTNALPKHFDDNVRCRHEQKYRAHLKYVILLDHSDMKQYDTPNISGEKDVAKSQDYMKYHNVKAARCVLRQRGTERVVTASTTMAAAALDPHWSSATGSSFRRDDASRFPACRKVTRPHYPVKEPGRCHDGSSRQLLDGYDGNPVGSRRLPLGVHRLNSPTGNLGAHSRAVLKPPHHLSRVDSGALIYEFCAGHPIYWTRAYSQAFTGRLGLPESVRIGACIYATSRENIVSAM